MNTSHALSFIKKNKNYGWLMENELPVHLVRGQDKVLCMYDL